MCQSSLQYLPSRLFGWLALCLAIDLAACGGGGNHGGDGQPVVAIAVEVAPREGAMLAGDTLEVTAVVDNDSADRGVSWSVSCSADPCGTVSPATTASGTATVYTAPDTVSQDRQVTVTATANSDSTRSATATLTISASAPPVSVSIAPATASVSVGGTILLAATVTHGTVSWSIPGCTDGPCGSIYKDQDDPPRAIYAAPLSPAGARLPSEVTVTATSVDDPSKSDSVALTLTSTPIGFATHEYPAGIAPDAMAIADFDGDGHLDVAVAGRDNSATGDVAVVIILLGDENGALREEIRSRAGQNLITGIAAGDLNGDDKLDLVATTDFHYEADGNGIVTVLLGNGDGTFQTPMVFAGGPYSMSALALADVNEDLRTDVAVAFYGRGFGLFIGAGDGTLEPPIQVATEQSPVEVVVSDLNRDGKLDLAAVGTHYPDADNPSDVSIVLGNGDGTFQPASAVPGVKVQPRSVASGDLNGDGTPDLVISHAYGWYHQKTSSGFSVLLGDGSGMFASRSSVRERGGGYSWSAKVADFDMDGKLDVAELDRSPTIGQYVTVRLGNGDGSVQGQLDVAAPAEPIDLEVGDLNGDGKPDMTVASKSSNSVSVLLNTSGP